MQAYFEINEQRTNDPDVYLREGETSTEQHRENLWTWTLRASVLQTLEADERVGEGEAGEFVDGYKENLLNLAMSKKKYELTTICDQMARVFEMQAASASSVGSLAPPEGMESTRVRLQDPDKPKHTTAYYDRSGTQGTQQIELDEYTKKGEERRARVRGGQQGWTKREMKFAIQAWNCKVPLVQHIAPVVFEHLENTDEGRAWEVRLREMARVLQVRITEAQNLELVITPKGEGENKVTLIRSDYDVEARKRVQAELVKGTALPGSQSEVNFYDDLIRPRIPPDWQTSDSGQLTLDPQKADSAAMTLTHWRTITFFDWLLGDDLMKCATNG